LVIEGDAAEDVREGENEEIVDSSLEGSSENAPKLKRVIVRFMKALFWNVRGLGGRKEEVN
jgi:hypothetical protein